ncbi:hypothetical protein PSTT_13283, partial [Puccinia striiformis]
RETTFPTHMTRTFHVATTAGATSDAQILKKQLERKEDYKLVCTTEYKHEENGNKPLVKSMSDHDNSILLDGSCPGTANCRRDRNWCKERNQYSIKCNGRHINRFGGGINQVPSNDDLTGEEDGLDSALVGLASDFHEIRSLDKKGLQLPCSVVKEKYHWDASKTLLAQPGDNLPETRRSPGKCTRKKANETMIHKRRCFACNYLNRLEKTYTCQAIVFKPVPDAKDPDQLIHMTRPSAQYIPTTIKQCVGTDFEKPGHIEKSFYRPLGPL